MSTRRVRKEKRGLRAWTTRDLLVAAVIGIVFGVILAGASNLAAFLTAALTPQVSDLILMPLFIMAGLMAPYIIRRPGTSLLSLLVAGLVMAPLNPYGFAVVAGQLIEGVVCELVLLIGGYRRWGWLAMFLLAAAAATPNYLMSFFAQGGLSLSPMLIGMLLIANFVLSGLGGMLAKALSDAIAKIGVLNGFAIAEEQQEEI
jgi:energy-coupling factor transport system substrate-specific component